MDIQAVATIGVLVLVVGTLVLTRIGPDLVMFGGLTLLLVFGVIGPHEALAGFSNEGVITIGVLYLVVAGLQDTGAMNFLSQPILGRPTSVAGAQARLMFPTAALSSVMNNTPLVAIMLPIVRDWAKRCQIPVSKLLIPLSYATILGGLCTLVGTSTNLVVSGLLEKTSRVLDFFDPAWVGIPCALVGLAYMLIFSRWLLPDHGVSFTLEEDPRQYTLEMLVEPNGSLEGKTIQEAGLRHLPGLFLVEIERGDQLLPAVSPQERLHGGDRLVFAGVVESVVDLLKIRGLQPATNQIFKLESPRAHRCLIEAVISNSCPLVGKSIREGKFRTVYNAAVLAVARNGERIRQKIGDIILQPGDTVLLEAHPWFVDRYRNSRDFFLMSRMEGSAPVRHEKAWLALAIFGAMILAAVTGWLSMLQAAMAAAVLMIVSGCCTGTAARESIEWRVLAVIACSFGIGQAMETSGVAPSIARALLGLAGQNPHVSLAIVYFVTMLFTETMSHNTAAVLIFPIAQATAQALDVNFMPFAMAIMIAASCGFASPISYQTNLMVYGPGGYRFSDFLRFGAPLNIVVGTVAILLIPFFWPM
jgi:di/tricarboxylate transporter